MSATSFPSGVRTIPVEATESIAPVVFYRREFRESSGGAGKFRGGLGQVIEIGGAGANPVALLVQFRAGEKSGARPRRRRGRRGRHGGAALGPADPAQGPADRAGARRHLAALPGGGGFGDPRTRDPQRVLDDVLDGLITAEEARRDYGVVIDARGEIDLAETARLRSP